MTANYGVFSIKQFNTIIEKKDNDRRDFPYIYYKDKKDTIVQVTEVFNDPDKKSRFDDAIYLGELKSFHGVSLNPINYIIKSRDN
jgi:hypothetical protein